MTTESQLEILSAIARVQNGSWECLNVTDVEDCIHQGWVFRNENHQLRLTEEGWANVLSILKTTTLRVPVEQPEFVVDLFSLTI